MVDEPTSCGGRGLTDGRCSYQREPARLAAELGGASWRAGASISYPSSLDGCVAAFVAAVAHAQVELWLPAGVAQQTSACAELCCVRERASVCMPHDACESRLRAGVTDGRRPRWCVRIVFANFGRHPLEEDVRHCVWY